MWSVKCILRVCFFPLSPWERVLSQGEGLFSQGLGPLTPALSRREREQRPLAQQFNSQPRSSH